MLAPQYNAIMADDKSQTAIAMDIKYPDLFAASLLVSCQWDPSLVIPMAKKPLWIVVSAGDTKANPGMDAITPALTLQRDVESLLSRKESVYYTVYEGGSHRTPGSMPTPSRVFESGCSDSIGRRRRPQHPRGYWGLLIE